MKDLTGLSIILGDKGCRHLGRYVLGTWFDDNHMFELPEAQRSGFGFKFDLAIGRVVRPIGYFWKPAFWKRDKPTILDILEEGDDYAAEFFGRELLAQIKQLNPYHYPRRTVWNPWFARHSFVFRLPRFIYPFISIGTPWFSFYVGFRSFKVDPFTKDRTWCGSKERRAALEDEPHDKFYALSLSISARKTREG